MYIYSQQFHPASGAAHGTTGPISSIGKGRPAARSIATVIAMRNFNHMNSRAILGNNCICYALEG